MFASPSGRPRLALAALLPFAALASCGGDDAGDTGDTRDTTTITMQTQFNDAESALMEDLVEEFEAANPGIRVELVRDGSDAYYDKLITQIVGGGGPDIARLEPPRAAQFVNAEYVAPLDDLVAEETRSDFFETTLEPLVKDDTPYGLPQDVSTLVLYYRTDLFEEAGLEGPPETWADLRTAAETLTQTGQHGIGLFGGWGAFEFYPWLWQAGGEVLTDDEASAAFDSEAGVRALQFWVDLQEDGLMPDGMATLTEDDLKGPFIGGSLAMFTSGPWIVASLEEANVEGKWGIAPLPADQKTASVLGGMALTVLENSEHKEEAAQFLDWFMQDKIQTRWATELGVIPVKQSLYDAPEFANDPLMATFREALETSRSRPTIAAAAEVDAALGEAVQAALSGTKSPEDALADAANAADEALAAK